MTCRVGSAGEGSGPQLHVQVPRQDVDCRTNETSGADTLPAAERLSVAILTFGHTVQIWNLLGVLRNSQFQGDLTDSLELSGSQ